MTEEKNPDHSIDFGNEDHRHTTAVVCTAAETLAFSLATSVKAAE